MIKPKKIKLKDGVRWEVDHYVSGRSSKRLRRRFTKKIDAEVYIKGLLKDNRPSNIDYSDEYKRTLKSEYDFWLTIRGREISPSHLRRVEGIISSVFNIYGDIRIESINNIFLANLRNDLAAKEYSPATINRWTSAITTVLNYSFKHNRISFNPCANFGLLNEVSEEINFWEEEEVKIFLQYANDEYQTQDRWVYLVYLLALNTGMRAGEVWGLKVKDIQFDRSLINIERQLLAIDRKVSSTKGKNIRKVPCNKKLKEELKNYIFLKRLEVNDFVFQTTTKTPIYHHNFRNRYFCKDLKKSNLRKIRFHDFRHTALTLMVEKGINLKVVQSIAGHADITTTMKYVHLLGSSVENVANSFELG